MTGNWANKFVYRYPDEKKHMILQILSKNGPSTRIRLLYGIESNSALFNRILQEMVSAGIVTEIPAKSPVVSAKAHHFSTCIIGITHKGRKALEKYSQMYSMLDWDKVKGKTREK